MTILECAEGSAALQSNVRHGEGAHAGHLLGFWDVAGVRNVVSVHGHGEQSRRLVEEVVEAIDLIDP